MLSVRRLNVEVGGSRVIKDLDLEVAEGEALLLLGPNGSGKTTLLHTIVGDPRYRVVSGSIIFDGVDITHQPMGERVKLGLGLSFQFPPRLRGVTLRSLALKILEKRGVGEGEAGKILERYAHTLRLEELLDKEFNVGFSGGEVKRAELMLTLIQKPKLLMLDEPDSGVDVENLALVGSAISSYLSEDRRRSAILITHTGYIAKHVKTSKACVMVDGRIVCRGKPEDIVSNILKHGFDRCVECEGLDDEHRRSKRQA